MPLDSPPKLTRRRVLAFALETTTGTPASVAAADAVTEIFGEVPIIRYQSELVGREPYGGLSPIVQNVGARQGAAVFENELKGNGATGSALWTRLLQGCGYVNAGGVWAPVDGATQTLTIAEWIDGRQRLLSGCMGTFTIVIRRGQKVRIRWSFMGVQQPPGDAANPTPTYVTTIAPRAGASNFTLFSQTGLYMPDINIDAGNKVIMREDTTAVDTAGKATGFRAAYITERVPMIRLAPEAKSHATVDWDAHFQACDQGAFSVKIGTAANNNFTIAAPAVQLVKDPADADRNRMLTDGLELQCNRNSSAGQDELTITQA